jgi:hypothetical protein
MFTPDHARCASEMARVTRPGGTIALASWTPEGFIGQLFKTLGTYIPPAAGLRSPALWGTEAHLRTIFGAAIADMQAVRKHFVFRYRSAAHFLDVFRTFYGPVHKAFGALPAEQQTALAGDLTALIARFARPADTLVLPSEYLEVVITRR